MQSWGKLPRGEKFGQVSSVAVDSRDYVYACHRREDPLVIFDREGRFVATWGKGIIAEAHGIFVDRDNCVYVVDRRGHQMLKFSPKGQVLMALGDRDGPSKDTPFNFPTDVWVSESGEIYVCDGYGNSQVHKFSGAGDLLLSWGSAGSGPGQFKVPHSVSIDQQGRIYVCDRDNDRIQIFTADSELITQWTDFCRPTDVYCETRRGIVYVTDQTPRVSIFDQAGTLLARGLCVDVPHGVCVDSHDDFYVVSNQAQRIDKYVNQRNLIA